MIGDLLKMKKIRNNFCSFLFEQRIKIKYGLAVSLLFLGIFLFWFNSNNEPERMLFRILPYTLIGFSLINFVLLYLKKCAKLVNTFLIIYGFEITLTSYMFYFKNFPSFNLYSNLSMSVGLLVALLGRYYNKLKLE